MRRLPFLGSWPAWQQALERELASLVAAQPQPQRPPQLLHHPVSGAMAERYLALLSRRCKAHCRPAAFDRALIGASAGLQRDAVFLPLALAANRLTETLEAITTPAAAAPLLARPRLRQALLEALLALP